MQKVVFIQADNKYFRQFRVALGSFIWHNKDWSAIVVDLGFSPEQRKAVEQIASVISAERYVNSNYKDRYAYTTGRLQYAAALARQYPNALFLQLDSDTLCLGSIDPWVSAFMKSKLALSFATEFINAQWGYHKPVDQVAALFPNARQWWNKPAFNWGVFLFRTPGVANVFERTLALVNQYTPLFKWSDQSAGAALIYDTGIPFFSVGPEYNYLLYQKPAIVAPQGGKMRLLSQTTKWEIRIAHFCGYVETRPGWDTRAKPGLNSPESMWALAGKTLRDQGFLIL